MPAEKITAMIATMLIRYPISSPRFRAPYGAFIQERDAQHISLHRATSPSELAIVDLFPVKGYDKSHTAKEESAGPVASSLFLAHQFFSLPYRYGKAGACESLENCEIDADNFTVQIDHWSA